MTNQPVHHRARGQVATEAGSLTWTVIGETPRQSAHRCRNRCRM